MCIRDRADRGDDPLADPGDDRLLAGTPDQPVDIRPHGYLGLRFNLDPVFGHRRHHRRLDYLRVDAHLHRLEHCLLYTSRCV